MGLQKFRSDRSRAQSDGAVLWYADWIGGPSLSKIANCRLATLHGDMRRTVYVCGEADTWFSIPAKARLMGCVLTGYLTEDDAGNIVFHQCYY